VPGRITALESRGANRLIQDGAALALGWEDVVAALPERWKACVVARRGAAEGEPAVAWRGAAAGEPSGYKNALPQTVAAGGPETTRILSLLGEDPLDIDLVIERSGLGAGRVSATLLDLELEGRVRQIEGKRFVRVGQG
jgi:DNA processing protein